MINKHTTIVFAVVSALLMSLGTALAFDPYNGQNFKKREFTAKGKTLIGDKSTEGEVSFKFKGDSTSTKCSFKGSFDAEGKKQKFKGELKFNPDGTCELRGLPGQKGTAKGTYRIIGTTVIYEGSSSIDSPLGKIEIKVTGRMSLDGKGAVIISGKVDGGILGSGTYKMNGARPAKK